jgi:hypothetical protein
LVTAARRPQAGQLAAARAHAPIARLFPSYHK